MLLMLGLFTACGSMSSEDVEMLDSVLTTVLEVAENVQESASVEENEDDRNIAGVWSSTETQSAALDTESDDAGEDVLQAETESPDVEEDSDFAEEKISEDGSYTSAEEVSLYLYLYGHLPENYITKKEARELGWDSSKGNLWDVAPGMSIGGDYFGNYEGLLPEEEDRDYYECDIDYEGGYRNSKRIIYSDDGLIFYTEDHYESFEQLY